MEVATMAQDSGFQVDRTAALYERPTMDVINATTFSAVKAAIASKYAPAAVEAFLKSIERAKLRIRDFEDVIKAGKLGTDTAAQYATLEGGDQGQIREFYLASLEQVESNLRDKYFKLYAYY
jgi:hypothetical protein